MMDSTADDPNGLHAPGRILVADDDPCNRGLLRDLLEAGGHAVIEATDGADALEKAVSEACDVILLDVVMPRMDGLEACRRLKANPETAHIPVLIVTALTEKEQHYQGIDAGANDYLNKPISRRDVLLRVRNALYAKRLHDKVRQDLAKLRELEILQDNLTHMIVHDMRTPLMNISLVYDMVLTERERLSPAQEDFIAMGQNGCRELIEMMTSMLDVSRLEEGAMPLNRTSCDLRDIVRKAAESVTGLIQGKALNVRISGDSINGNVDRDIMHRVVVNLLGNAIKFSPVGGTIDLQLSSTEKAMRVTVGDQGRGIPPEYRGKIFEKFGQVDRRTAGQKYSTGLGLTFCKLAVEAHGGRIGVESDVGQGSTFWFTLPAG